MKKVLYVFLAAVLSFGIVQKINAETFYENVSVSVENIDLSKTLPYSNATIEVGIPSGAELTDNSRIAFAKTSDLLADEFSYDSYYNACVFDEVGIYGPCPISARGNFSYYEAVAERSNDVYAAIYDFSYSSGHSTYTRV